jgi:hydroxymethylglutaryl-CoA lyase
VSDSVRIVEVGPRDGLQNETVTVPVDTRIAFIRALADAGLKTIEAGSFVSPKWVPQMAGTDAVLAAVKSIPGVEFPVLVPNEKGLDAAIAADAREIAIFAAASESFSQRNINCGIAESLERFRPVTERALEAGITVRGYVSCVLGCPYEGEITSSAVVAVSKALLDLGCSEISLGDTIGVGTPRKARDLIQTVSSVVPLDQLAVHFHDTYGQALANIYACLEEGVRVIDSAAGGLGGCPYARGASGNVATEDVVYMLNGLGMVSGVDLPKLLDAVALISQAIGREPASRVARAMRQAG